MIDRVCPGLVTDLRIARPWSYAIHTCSSPRDLRPLPLDVEEYQ
jgi:hypothetical protein